MNNSTNPMVAFKRELAGLNDQLPTSKDIPREKMESALIVAVQKQPKLLTADRSSLWLSARQCAADGLLPDGREAALVIFKTKINGSFVDAVQYIPMVFGLRKRAMKSGQVKDINAVIVYAGEWENGRFTYVEGDEPRIEHRPIVPGMPGEPERGDPVGAYAIATFKDGHKVRDFVNADDIDRVRRSAASQKVFAKGKKPVVSDEPIGAWLEWWDEFWKKTAVRRVSKKLPLSSEDQSIIQESDRDLLKDVTPAEEPEEPPLSFAERAELARLKAAEDAKVPDAETSDKAPETIDAKAEEVTEDTDKKKAAPRKRKSKDKPAAGDAATTHDDASAADDNNASKPPSQSTPVAKAEHGGEDGRGDPAPTDQDEKPSPIFMEGLADKLAGHKPSACPPDYSDADKAEWRRGYDSEDGPVKNTDQDDFKKVGKS